MPHLQHSTEWWLAVCLSTLVPVIYSVSGGMRASLVTDVLQAAAAIGLLIAVVILLGINKPASFGTWNPAGEDVLLFGVPEASPFSQDC